MSSPSKTSVGAKGSFFPFMLESHESRNLIARVLCYLTGAKLLASKKTSLPSIVIEDKADASDVFLSQGDLNIRSWLETTERSWTTPELRWVQFRYA
jgi:hypothetical protein